MEFLIQLPTTNLFIFFGLLYIFVSFLGFLRARSNIILILISLEIHFLAYHLILVSSSILHNDIAGLIFSIFCLTVAGAEVSLGLAIIILFYRSNRSINVNYLKKVKG